MINSLDDLLDKIDNVISDQNGKESYALRRQILNKPYADAETL